MPKNLVIIGAGGVGREIAAVLKKHPLKGYRLTGFIDDGIAAETIVNGLKVLGGISWIKDNSSNLGVILALGNPQARKKIADALQSLPISYPTLIHPNVSVNEEDTVKIGKGCYIADGCILTTDITIADFCFLNTGCTLQHDTLIGSYSVLMPGVRITGGAQIGSSVFINPNCVIITKCIVDDNSIIRKSILN